MEDDDEFGDLYADVLRPVDNSFQSRRVEIDVSASSQSRPIDRNVNSDDEEILYGALNLKNSNISNSAFGLNLNASIHEKPLPEFGTRPERGGFDLNLKAPRIVGGEFAKKVSGRFNFMDDDNNINIVVEERDNKDDELVEKEINLMEKNENTNNLAERNENTANLMGPSVFRQQMIPGVSGRFENNGGSNFEDEWESDDSEDDLKIVLNDNKLGPMGMERMPGMDDEDEGEPLVIVADNGDLGHQQMMMEDQEWGGEEVGTAADGERKEDAGKTIGGGAPAVQLKIGFSNHVYHHPFHSQFKYVRPGAAPIPGAAPVNPGAIPGQIRPPVTIGAVAGRGRGDWRPPGITGAVPMQKGLHHSAGRGYGSGLDFFLPSHKTIFEVDIETFEEKPWRLPGIDVSDFFNFGLNEDSWKDYCKQLEQLRLETTMQSKIRVYESGRAEKEYDQDLPPELTAAAGNQDTPSENANPGIADAGLADLARANACGRPSVQPIGRPIPVETGSGERLPSIIRRPRMHDIDAVIEIVCHSSTDDDDMEKQQGEDLAGEDLGGVGEIDDLRHDDSEHIDRISHAYNDRKRELIAREAQINCDEIGREVPVQDHLDREICFSHEERSRKGRGHVKSPKMTVTDNKREKPSMDDENHKSFDCKNGKQSQPVSSSNAIGSDEEQAIAVGDDANDESVLDDGSSDVEIEETLVGATSSDSLKDGNLMHSTKKQKFSSRSEELSPENDDGKDSKAAWSSENSKARSLYEDNARRSGQHERNETGRHHMAVKGREDSYSRRDEDAKGRRIKAGNTRNEIGSRNRGMVSESERREKDEHHQSRKNQVDNGSWRGANHNQDMGSRKRERDDNIKTRNEKVDDCRSKRRKEGADISWEQAEKEEITYDHRKSSNHRKRKRYDGSDQPRRDDHARLKSDDVDYVRQKEEGSFQREMTDRHRVCNEWPRLKQFHEEILSRREKEETQPVMRSGRAGKDDYRGSSREYHLKDVGQHNDHSKRRDRVENESFPQHTGHKDVYARGNEISNVEKRARYERPRTIDDSSRVHKHTQKKGSRKSKESESGDRGLLIPSKRNQDELGGQISETVSKRGRTEQESGEKDIHSSFRKQGAEAPSDDEQTNSRKGLSKFERWASHKERDFSMNSDSSSSLKNKDLDRYNNNKGAFSVSKLPDEPSNKVAEKPEPSADDKDSGLEMNDVDANMSMEDKHMDTVEKLKKRSERFKLPMPSEKDAMVVKKIESEPLPLAQTVNRSDSEIKSDRQPRRRKWTGR
ncbi:hypothetical protein BUALT_Bualt16G0085600 [Buddleja alternifolia]|uniref:Pre-mRNA polyadenylation factor Fip1 domain-containing protein n=1 Tax=Buddleja alternifolia TaxID=168488 RepID=A0AAV6WKR7_9LAMI|nr:hypothetical protein BUALT_Bualt16G0085600 [Buddleja alternifolia]